MADSTAIPIEDGVQIPEEGGRERSTIEFPYLDLDVAVEIAKGVHAVGGTSCQWDQLAARLNQAAKGGSFRLRMMTARTFGFVTYSQQTVNLTKLGIQLCDPQKEAAAKEDGFLTVPLYRTIYDKFKGVTLPPNDGLEKEMAGMGVSPKQTGKARQAFQRSAQQAGFFWSGPNRLVRPATKGSAAPAMTPNEETEKPEKKNGKDEEKKHPLIEGLIKALPEDGTTWPLEARKKWLQAAAMNFDYVYTDASADSASIKVSIERESSAK